jgi:glyoxylase-like metal-dependent hydrolase (beta-lactamase superfamily II)
MAEWSGWQQIDRRGLFVSVAAGVLGIAVIGTTTACSSASPTGGTSSGGTSSEPGASSGGALTWKRVALPFASAYLLVRGQEVAVVDTGTEGSGSAIGEGLTAAGLGWGAVRHVVLTHKHGDHVGGLASVAPLAPSAAVYAGSADLSEITGAGRTITPLADGAEVMGLQVLATPGHTPGHLSVFDPATGVLVAGDALRTTSGLQGSDPRYTSDEAAAAASVKKLAALDVRVILPGHGDPLTDGAKAALQRLAAATSTS